MTSLLQFLQPWLSRPSVRAGLWGTGSLILAITVFFMGSSERKGEVSSLVAPPSIEDVPGDAPTPSYADAVRKASGDRTMEALKNMTSAVPTPVVPVRDETTERQETSSLQGIPGASLDMDMGVPLNMHPESPGRERKDVLRQVMREEIRRRIDAWERSRKVTPATIITVKPAPVGEPRTVSSPAPVARGSSVSLPDKALPVRPGDLLYASLETEANSDVGGPVMARVLSGTFRGSVLSGNMRSIRDGIVLGFQKMTHGDETLELEAIALDPRTSSAALAGEVDHHWMERIVLPMAAAFVGGYGEISRMPTGTTRSAGLTETTQTNPLSARDKLMGAAGKGAEIVSRVLEEQAQGLRETVRLEAGMEIAVLVTGLGRKN